MATQQSKMVQLISQRYKSPRLRYLLDFIFGQVLNCSYRLLHPHETLDPLMPVIEYSTQGQHPTAIKVWDSGQLDGLIDPEACRIASAGSMPSISSDIFAEMFFHLSRMEEYGALPKDEYGRNRAVDSYLWQNNKLDLPVVDQTIEQLRLALNEKGAGLRYKTEFRFTATYDVDYPWLFLNRSWSTLIRGLGGDLLKGRVSIFRDRLATWRGKMKDPYDLWDDIVHIHQRTGAEALFFLLFTDRKGVDPSVPYQTEAYRQLVRRLQNTGAVGWHPGYYAVDDMRRWSVEKGRYTGLIGEEPSRSRQHFLRLDWPNTYRQLIASGIQRDYSLGYADCPGFRGGTSHPFFWYDLERECATPLKLYPLAFMEVSLNKYLGLSPTESYEKMINIEHQVRQYHGHLIGLWHNNSFYPEEGWGEEWLEVYKEFIKRF